MMDKKKTSADERQPNESKASGKNSTISKVLISDITGVGGGYSIQFRYTPKADGGIGKINCQWFPHLPTDRDIRRKVSEEKYNEARRQFIHALCQRLGATITIHAGEE